MLKAGEVKIWTFKYHPKISKKYRFLDRHFLFRISPSAEKLAENFRKIDQNAPERAENVAKRPKASY